MDWIKDKIYRLAFLVALLGGLGAFISNANRLLNNNIASIDWFEFIFALSVLIVIIPFLSGLGDEK
jgi:hypothetical protein